MQMLAKWCATIFGGAAALALPSTCAACGRLTLDEAPLCEPCEATVEPIECGCPRCGLPLPPGGARVVCLGCVRKSPVWDAAHAPYVFGGQLATAIRRWKLQRRPELSRPLARLLAPSLTTIARGFDALVPVPLHPHRLRTREFDQAALLAREARARDGPPVRDLLERTLDTPPQAQFNALGRQVNVRRAFRLAAGARVVGQRLCLVDDVLTTGATAGSCARVLLDGGAAEVVVLTLARALP